MNKPNTICLICKSLTHDAQSCEHREDTSSLHHSRHSPSQVASCTYQELFGHDKSEDARKAYRAVTAKGLPPLRPLKKYDTGDEEPTPIEIPWSQQGIKRQSGVRCKQSDCHHHDKKASS